MSRLTGVLVGVYSLRTLGACLLTLASLYVGFGLWFRDASSFSSSSPPSSSAFQRASDGGNSEDASLMQVLDASRQLQTVLSERMEESLFSVLPSLYLAQQGLVNLGAPGTEWELRAGHWVRPYSPSLFTLYPPRQSKAEPKQEEERRVSKQGQELPTQGGVTASGGAGVVSACKRVQWDLDAALRQPHSCALGQRRYLFAGVWMDWSRLHLELSRATDTPTVCVLACVDTPAPRCTRAVPCVHSFLLPPQQQSEWLELAEVYEAEDEPPWAKLKRDGVTAILNAGAGIGVASTFLATLFPQALVLSMEASPSHFQLLRHNCRPFGNIVPWNAALWANAYGAEVVDGAFLIKAFGAKSFAVARLNFLGSSLHTSFFPSQVPADGGPLSWLDSSQLVLVYQPGTGKVAGNQGKAAAAAAAAASEGKDSSTDPTLAYFSLRQQAFSLLPLSSKGVRCHRFAFLAQLPPSS